jgi:hypothetical protein
MQVMREASVEVMTIEDGEKTVGTPAEGVHILCSIVSIV